MTSKTNLTWPCQIYLLFPTKTLPEQPSPEPNENLHFLHLMSDYIFKNLLKSVKTNFWRAELYQNSETWTRDQLHTETAILRSHFELLLRKWHLNNDHLLKTTTC